MEDILQAVATTLRTLGNIRSRDVYLTLHENLLPTGVRQPSIGIKDGRIKRKELAGGTIEEVLTITCVAMVKVDSNDKSLVGESGVLRLIRDIDNQLDQNLLDLPGMESAWSPSETATQPFTTENKQWLVKKVITFEYERTRQR